jgi:hypothetical protein
MPTNLLDGIGGGAKLRKVADQDKKDESAAISYNPTPHNQAVEDHEREQQRSSSSTWSTAAPDEEVGGPDRAFQRQIAEELNARIARGRDISISSGRGRNDDNSGLLTEESRASMNVREVDDVTGEGMLSRCIR